MRAKILSASAGSGKTYRLAYKFVHDTIKHYNEKPYLYRAILAVTFTNKATEEMKSRIIKEFNKLIAEPAKSDYMADLKRDLALSEDEIIRRADAILRKILHDYSRFTILTIDKFFQRILRAFIKELGIDLNYNLELESATILTRSTDMLINDIIDDEELQQWIMEYAQENMDDNGNWDIRKKILTLGKELFKEHSKQSIAQSISKTELVEIIRKIEKSAAKSKQELVAIGQKAMEIMQQEGVEPSDFSGASNSFANRFAKYANGEIVDFTKTIRDKALSTEGWVKKLKKPTEKSIAAENAAIKLQPLLAQMIDGYDKSAKLINTLSLIKSSYRGYALLQDIYERVGHICNEEGVMLLSETKYVLSQFIDSNDAPFIYEKTGNRFERYMIDEFQDTSAKEWANFVPLLQNAMSQSEDNSVLIVGDVKQSIYRWRGGDWRILQQGVSKSLGQSDTELEVLANNYRSLPCVVNFNNMAVERVVKIGNEIMNNTLDKALESDSISHECYAELCDTLSTAYNKHKQTAQKRSLREGYVRVERYEEQPPLIECIESVIARGYSYGDIMILHRSHNDVDKTAKILLDYKQQNNAFNILTQESLIIGKAQVSDFIISLMRLSQNPDDTISRALVNHYKNEPYDKALSQEELDTLSAISQLTPEQAFEKIVLRYELSSHKDDIAYLQAMHEQVVTFCSSKVADIQLFLKYWDETGASKALIVEKSDSTIELSTIHKAKGLEKKVVIIPYCNWPLKRTGAGQYIWATATNTECNSETEQVAKMGQFPIECNKDMGNSIYGNDYYRELIYSHVDNINILYVALTRACEELYVYIPNKSANTKESKSGKEESIKNIGALLWSAVNQDLTDAECNFIEYGSADAVCSKAKALDEKQTDHNTSKATEATTQPQTKNVLIDEYPSNDYDIKLSLPAQRYFEEGADSISSLQMGIMMHKILSEADNAEKIKSKIREVADAGTIDNEQAEMLGSIIEREFENPLVKEWFDSEWDMVRCECDIVQGQKLSEHNDKPVGTLRPDRVMVKGDRCVVVDYKFGNISAKSHIRQMQEYMSLMSQMGYSQIEGYVWYLTRSEIVRV